MKTKTEIQDKMPKDNSNISTDYTINYSKEWKEKILLDERIIEDMHKETYVCKRITKDINKKTDNSVNTDADKGINEENLMKIKVTTHLIDDKN